MGFGPEAAEEVTRGGSPEPRSVGEVASDGVPPSYSHDTPVLHLPLLSPPVICLTLCWG